MERIPASELLESFSDEELLELMKDSFDEYGVPYEEGPSGPDCYALAQEAINAFVEAKYDE